MEDEAEGEELEVCSKEKMESDWACTWARRWGGCLHWQRKGLGATLPGILVLPRLMPLLFYFFILFSPFCL